MSPSADHHAHGGLVHSIGVEGSRPDSAPPRLARNTARELRPPACWNVHRSLQSRRGSSDGTSSRMSGVVRLRSSLRPALRLRRADWQSRFAHAHARPFPPGRSNSSFPFRRADRSTRSDGRSRRSSPRSGVRALSSTTAGRRRQHRCRPRCQVGAGRLHGGHGRVVDARGQPQSLSDDALRRGQGFRADHARRRDPRTCWS